MAIVYLGLGSNLGDREKNLRQALVELEAAGIALEKFSTFIETEPVGGPPQGKFLNAALKARTTLTPEALLQQIKEIEKKMGRTDTGRCGPRPIDIDILLYDRLSLATPQLTIPHPRMHERAFVLAPLKEIDPSVVEEILHADR